MGCRAGGAHGVRTGGMWRPEAPEDGPLAPVADPGCRGCGVRAPPGTPVQTPAPSAPSSAPPGFAKTRGDGETGVRPGPAPTRPLTGQCRRL